MAAKMAVYNKTYKKIVPETGKLQEFACKIILLIFELKPYPCNIPVMLLIHHSECDIFKMASRMVPDKFYNPVRPTCRHV